MILLKTILSELKGDDATSVLSPSSPRVAKSIDVNAKRTLIVEACSILQFLTQRDILPTRHNERRNSMLVDVLKTEKNCSLSWDIIRGYTAQDLSNPKSIPWRIPPHREQLDRRR